MRAFSPSIVAYFAALSATVVQSAKSAAIPRSQQESTSTSNVASASSNPHVVVYHDGGRPQWGFVIPNRKRAVDSVRPIYAAIMTV